MHTARLNRRVCLDCKHRKPALLRLGRCLLALAQIAVTAFALAGCNIDQVQKVDAVRENVTPALAAALPREDIDRLRDIQYRGFTTNELTGNDYDFLLRLLAESNRSPGDSATIQAKVAMSIATAQNIPETHLEKVNLAALTLLKSKDDQGIWAGLTILTRTGDGRGREVAIVQKGSNNRHIAKAATKYLGVLDQPSDQLQIPQFGG